MPGRKNLHCGRRGRLATSVATRPVVRVSPPIPLLYVPPVRNRATRPHGRWWTAAAVVVAFAVPPATAAMSFIPFGEEGAVAAGLPYRPPAPAQVAASAPAPVAPPGMVWVPAGEFAMGSDGANDALCELPGLTKDCLPIHRVALDGYWIDRTEVTNDEFAAFVAATGYVTIAERKPRQEDYPTAPPENLVAGSVVFAPTTRPVPLDDHFQWWAYVAGADWRHPSGPGSSIVDKGNHPVVHVGYEDAEAYAKWAGKRLPTEAEWEYAARGRLEQKRYPWGDELKPGDRWMANIWEGRFPVNDSADDGFAGIAPVAQFPANGFGLHDVAGNVWEWTSDWYRPDTYAQQAKAGVVRNPRGPDSSFDPSEPREKKKVLRGGSYLCTDQYCTRYMVGTRGKGEVTSGSNHLGFRCVKDAPAPARVTAVDRG
jgi:sulfatase modifying factor 1